MRRAAARSTAPGDTSVIIPVFNGEATVWRAITTVLAQTDGGLEIVVVDDGSTDGTRQAVLSFDDPRVRYLWQPNRGVSAARNAGVAQSHGSVLTFLDDDDEVLPTWLERLREVLATPGCALSFCGLVRVDAATGSRVSVGPRPLGAAFSGLTGQFLAGTFAVRRELFSAVGGYHEGLRFGENTELGMRLAAMCRQRALVADAIDEELVVWHVARTRSPDPEAVLDAASYILQRHRRLLGRDRVLLADHHALAGVNALRLGRTHLARRHLYRAARARPFHLRHAGRLLTSVVTPLARRAWPPAPPSGANGAGSGPADPS